ncbi:helix-turn-helix domain-containing protein [Chryseobacterium gallinarum]|uniref:helix-turn-helix domain-containing protein n=1 Tax=Chryseobacterium gallinarum TaxID=1324352 RepID=UPI0020254B1B|nr:helix-turn-helix domain-containing protein [Chryseobacterium gallinarum]MCL8538632.1 helix-turn-helix domain-containing protein [Chryseobacterium gallinarum]
MKKLYKDCNITNDIIYIEYNSKNIQPVEKIIRDGFLSLFLFEKGEGVHKIGNEEYNVRERQVHIVFPDQMQELKLAEPSNFHLIMISKTKLPEIIGGMQVHSSVCKKNPAVTLPAEIFEILTKECKSIGYEIMENSCVMQYIIESKIKIIMHGICREVKKEFADFQLYDLQPILSIFIVLIRKSYKDDRSVHFYAGKLGITANYLNVLCRKHLKKTASAVIDSVVIPMLKDDILNSDDLLINIAYEYSFQNYVHFSRYFKKYVGLSPMAYRKLHDVV